MPADCDSPLLRMIGRRVRLARELSGMTQGELAEKVCMSRPSVANLEAGRQDMPVTRLALVAYMVDLTLADLVTEPVPAGAR